eukprot:SAG11_NODE_1542_length_4717_cov_2.974881_3_plen_82_part_00
MLEVAGAGSVVGVGSVTAKEDGVVGGSGALGGGVVGSGAELLVADGGGEEEEEGGEPMERSGDECSRDENRVWDHGGRLLA